MAQVKGLKKPPPPALRVPCAAALLGEKSRIQRAHQAEKKLIVIHQTDCRLFSLDTSHAKATLLASLIQLNDKTTQTCRPNPPADSAGRFQSQTFFSNTMKSSSGKKGSWDIGKIHTPGLQHISSLTYCTTPFPGREKSRR